LLVNAGFVDNLGNTLFTSGGSSGKKDGGILNHQCQEVNITVNSGTITVSDNWGAGGSGQSYTQGLGYTWRSARNTINLQDRVLTGAAGGETLTLTVESV